MTNQAHNLAEYFMPNAETLYSTAALHCRIYRNDERRAMRAAAQHRSDSKLPLAESYDMQAKDRGLCAEQCEFILMNGCT